MKVCMTTVVYHDAALKNLAYKKENVPMVMRDLYLNMFSVVIEEDTKMTVKDKTELTSLYRKLLKSTDYATLSSEEVTLLKERAARCYPAPAMFSQILVNLEGDEGE